MWLLSSWRWPVGEDSARLRGSVAHANCNGLPGSCRNAEILIMTRAYSNSNRHVEHQPYLGHTNRPTMKDPAGQNSFEFDFVFRYSQSKLNSTGVRTCHLNKNRNNQSELGRKVPRAVGIPHIIDLNWRRWQARTGPASPDQTDTAAMVTHQCFKRKMLEIYWVLKQNHFNLCDSNCMITY